jgi:monovalent cation:H+ antiporter-2, CPA2 family
VHLPALIHDLAVILAAAGLVAVVFHKIRQPVTLGYILAGMFVGPHFVSFPSIKDIPNIQTWAEIGVIFLMFSLGLEFSFRRLMKVGISAGITATFITISMTIVGIFTGTMMGWSFIESFFLGAMISISSTTIILKALEELNLKTRRFAEYIMAVLIVEDLVAIILLVALTTMGSGAELTGMALLQSAGKLVLVVSGWFLVGYFVVPRFVQHVGQIGSEETLTIVTIGLCFLLVVFASHFEYSAALGAFVMGSILAETVESRRIEHLVKPLRDVFGAVFFVSVGMLIEPGTLIEHWGVIAILTVIVILGSIIFATFAALVTGQSLRTSIQVGFGLTQIGEFSFIMAGLAVSMNVTDKPLYPIAVAVSLITTFLTPYWIRSSHVIALFIENKLPQKFRQRLNRYSVWWEQNSREFEKRSNLYRAFARWLISGAVVTIIFVLSAELLLPVVQNILDGSEWAYVVGWIITVLISAPFFWSLFSSFHVVLGRAGGYAGTVFVSRLAGLIWIGVLSLQFLPIANTLILTFVGSILLFVVFYRRLETSFQWFESTFLKTFEAKERSLPSMDFVRDLAPWDAHLVRVKIHPNAKIAGESVQSSQIRTRFGITIVAIRRGLADIVAPAPNICLFPHDELFVLGTDDQIETAREYFDRPQDGGFGSVHSYEMRPFRFPTSSSLIGKSIRASGIREKYHSIVVGIERQGARIMSPESDEVLKAWDVVWIVGTSQNLNHIYDDLCRI